MSMSRRVRHDIAALVMSAPNIDREPVGAAPLLKIRRV
jgi:hypothetical protein